MYYIVHVNLGDFVDGVKQQCISNVWNWIETYMSRTENCRKVKEESTTATIYFHVL